MSRMSLMNISTPDKILIVDDTPENISLLSEILQNKGYQVSASKDGERAIKIAGHTQPDLILLDIMMPGIDGFETCRQLKKLESTKYIPVIFISAKIDIDDLVMGFSVGGVDYINKPFHKEEIYSRVENQLKILRLHQKLMASELSIRELFIDFQQQADQLQLIFTMVIDGLLELNRFGEIQEANPAIEKLFGYSAQALHSMNFSKLLAEPFSSHYAAFFTSDKSESKNGLPEEKGVEVVGHRFDGSEFPIEFSLIKIPAKEITYLAIIHDITVSKNKEQQLRHLSYSDPLTDLANRRHFEEEYEKIWLQGQQTRSHIAFIMIDIDFFKQFNDRYGHQTGDKCLKKVAASLKDNIKRPCDFVARIGGEEFAVILPNTSTEGAVQLAEQLRKNVQALEIPHIDSINNVITISLGIAITTVGETCHSSSMLYQMADEALYKAKSTGRNRYTLF